MPVCAVTPSRIRAVTDLRCRRSLIHRDLKCENILRMCVGAALSPLASLGADFTRVLDDLVRVVVVHVASHAAYTACSPHREPPFSIRMLSVHCSLNAPIHAFVRREHRERAPVRALALLRHVPWMPDGSSATRRVALAGVAAPRLPRLRCR